MSYCINHACHRDLRDDWAFCPYCGHDNRPPGSHTPAAVPCTHEFPFRGAYCVRCGAFELAEPLAAARRSALRAAGGTRIAVFAVGGLSLLAFYFWTHRPAPQDAAIARALVDAAYASAERGDLSDITYDRYQWKRLQDRYGRVLSYRIVSDRYLWGQFRLGADFEYEVDVHRERAHSRENVQVAAHRSRLYGYWSGVERITSESTTP